jgi:hypothetical protein
MEKYKVSHKRIRGELGRRKMAGKMGERGLKGRKTYNTH